MVIFRNENLLSVNLWYPILGRRGSYVTAVDWITYSRGMVVYAAINLLLLVSAVMMTNAGFYDDNLFNILSVSMFLNAFVRLFRNRKRRKISVSKCDSAQLAPFVAWVDVISFFLSISVILVICIRQMVLDERGAAMITVLEVCAILSIGLIAIFLANALAFFLGIGKKSNWKNN